MTISLPDTTHFCQAQKIACAWRQESRLTAGERTVYSCDCIQSDENCWLTRMLQDAQVAEAAVTPRAVRVAGVSSHAVGAEKS